MEEERSTENLGTSGSGTREVKSKDPGSSKVSGRTFNPIQIHRLSLRKRHLRRRQKTHYPTVRSCEDNANSLVPHSAIGRSGQRLQMSAMPHIRRRSDTASRRGSISPDTKIFDELHTLVLWHLRGCCNSRRRSKSTAEGEMGSSDCRSAT